MAVPQGCRVRVNTYRSRPRAPRAPGATRRERLQRAAADVRDRHAAPRKSAGAPMTMPQPATAFDNEWPLERLVEERPTWRARRDAVPLTEKTADSVDLHAYTNLPREAPLIAYTVPRLDWEV